MHRALALLLALALLCGCAAQAGNTAAQTEFFAMDTYMTVKAYGADEAALAAVRERVDALEAKLSVTREDSAIARLNADGSAQLDDETAALLRSALALCEETGGALDLSVYPVVRAWGFTTGEHRVPDADELAALVANVDYRAVTVNDDGLARLGEGMEIDLGSVAKGYAADCLRDLLRERGVTSALLDLGGNVAALGGKPDGSDWRVGVRDPAGEGLLGTLPIRDECVVTSGGYERYFVDADGNLRWHIIDPADGYPAKSGLVSVTVVGPEGLRCDALSTALFILGEAGAAAYWRAHGDFDMALVTEDGRLLLTPALARRFTQSADAYRLEVIGDA